MRGISKAEPVPAGTDVVFLTEEHGEDKASGAP